MPDAFAPVTEFQTPDPILTELLNVAGQMSKGIGNMDTGLHFADLLDDVTLRLTIAKETREGNSKAIEFVKTKPTAVGAYYVRGFRRGEPDSRPALVEVDTDVFGSLMCNLNAPNTTDNLDAWTPVASLSDDFEWFGPLVADGGRVAELEARLERVLSEARNLHTLCGDLVEHESEADAAEYQEERDELDQWFDDCERFLAAVQRQAGPSTQQGE